MLHFFCNVAKIWHMNPRKAKLVNFVLKEFQIKTSCCPLDMNTSFYPRQQNESTKRNYWYTWVSKSRRADFNRALNSEIRSQCRTVSPVKYLLRKFWVNIYREVRLVWEKKIHKFTSHTLFCHLTFDFCCLVLPNSKSQDL